MTANAFSEDRDRSLKSGMNEHVTKPIEPEKLFACLVRFLPADPARGGGTSAPSPGEASVPVSTAGHLERLRAVVGLCVEDGLRSLRGDAVRYVGLLRQYVDHHGEDARTVSRMVGEGNFEAVRQVAHALKGVSATLGLREIRRLASDLEQAAKAEDPAGELRGLVEELERTFAVTVNALQAVYGASTDEALPEVPTVDPKELAGMLDRLDSLLVSNDTAAVDFFEESRAAIVGALGDKGKLFERQVQNFDFPEALETLRSSRKPKSASPSG